MEKNQSNERDADAAQRQSPNQEIANDANNQSNDDGGVSGNGTTSRTDTDSGNE